MAEYDPKTAKANVNTAVAMLVMNLKVGKSGKFPGNPNAEFDLKQELKRNGISDEEYIDSAIKHARKLADA